MSLRSHDSKKPNRLKKLIAGLFWRLTPDCREVVRLTSEEIDRGLPFFKRLQLRFHRIFCKYCARYFRQVRFLRVASRRLPRQLEKAGTASLSFDARSRIKRALQEKP